MTSIQEMDLEGSLNNSIVCLSQDDGLSNNLEDYTLGDFIAKGSFGSVSKITYNPTGKVYAIKTMKSAYDFYFGDYDSNLFSSNGSERQEIDFLLQQRHPNIVEGYKLLLSRSYSAFNGSTKVMPQIIMELADTNLKKRYRDPMSVEQKVYYMYQLVSGMKFISDLGYLHCDLKADNILIFGDKLKIGDLGLLINKNLISGFKNTDHCNPPLNRAPEFLIVKALEYIVGLRGEEREEVVKWINAYKKYYVIQLGYSLEYPHNSYTVSYEDLRRGEFFSLGKLFLEIYLQNENDGVKDTFYKTFHLPMLPFSQRVEAIQKLEGYPEKAIPGMDHLIASLLEADPKLRISSFSRIMESPVFGIRKFKALTKGFTLKPQIQKITYNEEIKASLKKITFLMLQACNAKTLSLNHFFKALALFHENIAFAVNYSIPKNVYQKLCDLAICCLNLVFGRNLSVRTWNYLDQFESIFVGGVNYTREEKLASFYLNFYVYIGGIVYRDSTFDYASSTGVAIKSIKYYLDTNLLEKCSPMEYVFLLEKNVGLENERYRPDANVNEVYDVLTKEILEA